MAVFYHPEIFLCGQQDTQIANYLAFKAQFAVKVISRTKKLQQIKVKG